MDELDNLINENTKGDQELTLEQQFSIIQFNTLMDGASKEQAIEIAKKAYRAYVIRAAITTKLVAHSWGIGMG